MMDAGKEARKAFLETVVPAVRDYIHDTTQEASYALGDLLNPLDPVSEILYLAVMQMTVDARKAHFDERDSRIFEHVLKHSTLTILPTEFDPRKKEE